MVIIGAIAIASLMVTFQLCWRKHGTARNVLIPLLVMAACSGTLYWMYQTLATGAEPQIREQWLQWLLLGAAACIGGPLIGAGFALIARRRVPNGTVTYGRGRPGQFNH